MTGHAIDLTPFRPPAAGTQPDNDAPDYRSTRNRHPLRAPIPVPTTITEAAGPRLSPAHYPPITDLSVSDGRTAIGQRIIVGGRVSDENGRPIADTMIEIWQANAAGRYDHPGDDHDAPLDPHFRGEGRVFTDADGRYQFVTIKPGAYPWRNHDNAWRPNHIHFSLLGPAYATRLVTQMYFPGDPLLALDPIYHAIADPDARQRLVATFDLGLTRPETALGYRFDIVLRGRQATPMEA